MNPFILKRSALNFVKTHPTVKHFPVRSRPIKLIPVKSTQTFNFSVFWGLFSSPPHPHLGVPPQAPKVSQ